MADPFDVAARLHLERVKLQVVRDGLARWRAHHPDASALPAVLTRMEAKYSLRVARLAKELEDAIADDIRQSGLA